MPCFLWKEFKLILLVIGSLSCQDGTSTPVQDLDERGMAVPLWNEVVRDC